jgi:hypothetical protein
MPPPTIVALILLIPAGAALGGCARERKTATLEDLYTREVRLPDGARFRVDVASKAFERTRGLMFRESLPPDRGMLFINPQPGKYPYFMYQVQFPIDIIWLDKNRLITEIAPDTPPCSETSASKCPTYGGNQPSLYVLELNAGMAAKHNLSVGDRVEF